MSVFEEWWENNSDPKTDELLGPRFVAEEAWNARDAIAKHEIAAAVAAEREACAKVARSYRMIGAETIAAAILARGTSNDKVRAE